MQAAVFQLIEAIELFFEERNPVSIHICNENKFKEYLRTNKVLTIVDIYMIILLEKEQIKSIEALNSIVDKLSVKYTSTYNKPLYGEEKNKL